MGVDDKKMLKEDINFLEMPNWVVDQKTKLQRLCIEKPNGKYELVSPHGLPTHFDKIVLYSLLYKLFEDVEGKKLEIVTTRYAIAKSIFGRKITDTDQFARIMKSLKKWKGLTLNFEGVFYSDNVHTVRYFSVIDDVILNYETKQLFIRFNQQYIQQLQETKFYKFIDFQEYKKLSRAISARLYEILIKTFKERDTWSISIQNLAEKLTLEMRKGAKNYYASDVLTQIRSGINEINKKTELVLEFSYDKGNGLCMFKKAKQTKQTFKPAIQDQKTKKDMSKTSQDDICVTEVVSRNEMFNSAQEECLRHFETFSDEERSAILLEIERDPFIKYLPDQALRIYTFLINHNMWQPKVEQKAVETGQSKQ